MKSMRFSLTRATETQRHRGTVFHAVILVLLFACAPVAAQQPAPQPQQQDEFVPVSQLPPQDQLPAAPLLVTAYAFVWLVLFGYVVSVGRRLSLVQHEVQRLESDIKKATRS